MGLRSAGYLCLLLASGLAAPSADATITLIADGTLTSSSAGSLADLSGLTGTLENGLPANLLGGVGSALYTFTLLYLFLAFVVVYLLLRQFRDSPRVGPEAEAGVAQALPASPESSHV